MNDLFKPLYKQHRHADLASITGVFDPVTEAQAAATQVGDYSLVRTEDGWICTQLPGLRIIPNALTFEAQSQFVRESVQDYLESSQHLTNLDAHYPSLSRPLRLFSTEAAEKSILPDAKGTSVASKLRWVTLGGQYNWITKEYPSFEPGTPGCPYFPESLGAFIGNRFGITSEAAIVNYYSEGNILSPHRDVAELSAHDLVSISLGCTCIFYVAEDRYDVQPLPIVLRSGDVVVMGGDSRFAFHGVGRVFRNTTPKEVYDSMDLGVEFREWMQTHRININVRQMR